MSDDQNPAPRSEGETPATTGAHDAAAHPAPPAPPIPPAPAADAPSYAPPTSDAPAAPAYDAPATPTYDAPAAPAYGAPAAPPYGTPAYGQAPAYGQTTAYGQSPYGSAPVAGGYGSAVRTNVLAIISLVASIAGFIGLVPVIGPITGVITGHISLAQIKRTGEQGRGMALAGTIIGWVGIGVVLLLTIFFIVFVGIAASQSSRYGA
ncbi:DUF4190 domain-containing protein [Microbacterium proteolyticum]|uniref:DUF4190 domain-containing protein n=1 Tax=Microbacterium proteolyticum TaxID=1572644 RepID=UPI0024159711|nr:DUF4190 domain-containing protein [Microbacterium proteolyticum]